MNILRLFYVITTVALDTIMKRSSFPGYSKNCVKHLFTQLFTLKIYIRTLFLSCICTLLHGNFYAWLFLAHWVLVSCTFVPCMLAPLLVISMLDCSLCTEPLFLAHLYPACLLPAGYFYAWLFLVHWTPNSCIFVPCMLAPCWLFPCLSVPWALNPCFLHSWTMHACSLLVISMLDCSLCTEPLCPAH